MAAGARGARAAGRCYHHPGRPYRSYPPPATVVDRRAGARTRKRPPDRGILCRTPGAYRACPRLDRRGPTAHRYAVGTPAAATRGRRLRRRLSRSSVDLHPGRGQRLRGHPGLAGPARIPSYAARLPQGSRTADPVGHRRASEGPFILDDQGCDRLSGILAQTHATRTLGRTTTATHVAGLAPVCR